MAEVVKRLHMISQIIGIIHNNPYDLSGTAGIERPFTKLLQQRFVTIHTDIIFDNRIAFFFKRGFWDQSLERCLFNWI